VLFGLPDLIVDDHDEEDRKDAHEDRDEIHMLPGA